jgi:hypothetical protein
VHLLTFELNEAKNELTIHGDQRGLQILSEAIQRLIAGTAEGQHEHLHLATEEWAGTELSSESQSGEVINQVTIYCWKSQSKE